MTYIIRISCSIPYWRGRNREDSLVSSHGHACKRHYITDAATIIKRLDSSKEVREHFCRDGPSSLSAKVFQAKVGLLNLRFLDLV